MASIVVRNLDEGVKERLRVRAAVHGRSMEAEARVILHDALGETADRGTLGALVRRHFGAANGVDLTPWLPERELERDPPDFS